MKLRGLTFLFYLAVIVGIGMTSCTGKSSQKNSQGSVEYYRNLQFSETPYDLEKGTHKLSTGQAKTINSYRFSYDNSGRLLSVEYVRGDSLLGYGSIGGAAKIIYEYKDNKQVKHFFDKNNQPVEPSGVYAAEYTLNEKGIRTGLKFFSKNGDPVENRNKIHSYVWSILPDGMVRELRYDLTGKETVMNPFCPFFELRFTYNEKGYITRMANYMADTLYNCTAENCGDIGVSYFTFVPNESGDVETFSVFNVTGQMSNLYWGWSKRVNKYDENGYVLETVYFDQDNEYLGGKNIPVTQYLYDSHGAVVEVKNMDKERNIINNPETGVAITEYKYNEAGTRTETIRYNKDKAPVKL
jgi:hypothetical protein